MKYWYGTCISLKCNKFVTQKYILYTVWPWRWDSRFKFIFIIPKRQFVIQQQYQTRSKQQTVNTINTTNTVYSHSVVFQRWRWALLISHIIDFLEGGRLWIQGWFQPDFTRKKLSYILSKSSLFMFIVMWRPLVVVVIITGAV